mgnify:CR=1 FL=1
MKKKLCLPTLSACAALAVWGVVGCSDEPAETQNNTNNNPNPAWAVPGTEILIVEDRLNQDVPNKAAWEALQKKTQALVETSGITIPEELQPLLKATLGMTPEGEMPALRHMTCAVTLPDSSEAFNVTGNACPEGLGIYCFVGYPEANIGEANKAIEKLIADNPWCEVKVGKDGDWNKLESTDSVERPFIGWRAINGGYTVSFCETKEVADRATNNTEKPAADSALAKAFQAPTETGPWAKIVIRDVADLMNRYITSPTDRQEVMLNAPFLFQMHALTFTGCYNSDGNIQLTVEANTDSEETAMLMRDQFIAIKVMAHQMIVPQFTGTPYAEPFAQLADSVTCEATGTTATLTLTVTPAQAEALVDLCVSYQGALANGPSGDPFADDEPYFGAQE